MSAQADIYCRRNRPARVVRRNLYACRFGKRRYESQLLYAAAMFLPTISQSACSIALNAVAESFLV